MLKQVLVASTIRTSGAVSAITATEIGLLKTDPSDKAVKCLPFAPGDKDVYLAAGRSGGGLFVTPQLNYGELYKVSHIPYSAGTAQVSTVTLVGSNPGTWFVKIMDTSVQTFALPTKTFEVTAASATAAATAIRALINADKDVFKDYVASGSAGAIVITAPINTSFKLAATEGSTIAYTGGSNALPVPSTGRPSDVQDLWKKALALTGVTNQVGFPVISPASPVIANETYDLVVAEFRPVFPAKHGMDRTFTEKYHIVVALADATDAGELFDFLQNLNANKVAGDVAALDVRVTAIENA
jgi:hypothetical protein